VAPLLDREGEVLERFRAILEARAGMRLRVHGDFHLGQVLWTGKDFVLIDFEGEPARALSERRIKRSPLTDVAGMVRSFQYAAYTALQNEVHGEQGIEGSVGRRWARLWYDWVAAAYVRAYLEAMEGSGFLPGSRREIEAMLDALLLDKAMYELRYEAANRPDWIAIPVEGVLELIEPQTP
jgi:maltose alpha-D-glucosyltransferase/alpha-amylase